jgi:hypothetical protein
MSTWMIFRTIFGKDTSVFPFRAVVRSQSAKISSWLYSANPAEAHAQLLCEKSPLLEGDEVAGL